MSHYRRRKSRFLRAAKRRGSARAASGFGRMALACLAVFCMAALTGCTYGSPGGATSVILLVGDGMGSSHRDAARLAGVGASGELVMDALPYAGMVHNIPEDADKVVTDSAAAGTALASGVKTYDGAVGVGPDGKPVTTTLEEARRAGKATGLVTTSQVTDATPAAFAAHVPSREAQGEIARQYVDETKPDVILGGGRNRWYEGEDGNLVDRASGEGWEYVDDAEALEAAVGPRILGLFADEEMFKPGIEGEGAYDPAVPLAQMTEKAIDVLSKDPDGFFLVVEEEAVDAMSHSNNAPLMIEAGRRLDEAVGVAADFAGRERDTLVVVTADHECGGLALEEDDGSADDATGEDEPVPVKGSGRVFVADWTTTEHTAQSVPLSALGPGAERLVGTYENTRVHEVLSAALAP